MTQAKPLSGIRVIDLSRILAGPSCGQLLADMGAAVIKVEPPWGDDNRRWEPFNDSGASCNYLSVNRGKRSLTLDLKVDAGRQVLLRALEKADVLLHSFLPGTARKLGIDYAMLHEKFPRLVVCALSGYGEQGPMRDVPAYDVMLQAFTGIMSVTGEPGRLPLRAGVSLVDLVSGIYAYAGVSTALLQRAATGEGSYVRVSLLESGLALLGHHATSWFEAGWVAGPQGAGSEHIVPYQVFRCADGHVVASANNESQWQHFAAALGLEQLAADPRFAGNSERVRNRTELVPLLEQVFLTREAAFWIERLLAVGVPAAPVHRVDQALSHPQALANGMVATTRDGAGNSTRVLGLPFKVGDTVLPADASPPLLGEHTDEILLELGFDAEQVRQLRSQKAV